MSDALAIQIASYTHSYILGNDYKSGPNGHGNFSQSLSNFKTFRLAGRILASSTRQWVPSSHYIVLTF